MKTKLLAFLLLLSGKNLYSQEINGPQIIDSLIEVINESIRNKELLVQNDSGTMINPGSQSAIGSYRRSKHFDKERGNLKLELLHQKFDSGLTLYDSYYYWDSTVIFVERLSFTKKELNKTRAFYHWKDRLYERQGNSLALCGDSAKLVGNRLLLVASK